MTNAGWYPDPAGQPNTYRYWNGHSWSEQTTANPAAPPPGHHAYGQPAAPQPPTQAVPPPAYGAIMTPPPGGPGGYGQPGYGAAPPGHPGGPGGPGGTGGDGGSGGAGKTIALVTLAVVLILALGVGAFLVVRSLGDDDTSARGDDSSESASPEESDDTDGDEPTDEESGGGTVQPTEEQCQGGRPDPGRLPATSTTLTGGGLTIPSLVEDGYLPDAESATPFTWADDYQLSYKVVPDAGESWVANYGVGGMAKANGIETTEQAAEVALACMTASPLYEGFSGTTDLEVGPVSVDGHEAYSILTEVRVDNPDVTVEGDVAQVVVVDTGDPKSFGLYISVVPIGDQASIDQQAEVFGQIQVG